MYGPWNSRFFFVPVIKILGDNEAIKSYLDEYSVFIVVDNYNVYLVPWRAVLVCVESCSVLDNMIKLVP